MIVYSIDPRNGHAVMAYDQETKLITVLYFHTLSKTKFDIKYKDDKKLFGNNTIFLDITRDYVIEIMEKYKPHLIVSEDAFLNTKFVNTFRILSSWITIVTMTLYSGYKKYLHTLAPKEIKLYITGNGKAEKEEMKEALLKRKDIIFKDENYLENLTEHSIDAICVGITKLKQLYP